MKPKKFVSPTTKGIQCYNCLSFDHPGCWDPDHPDYANITVSVSTVSYRTGAQVVGRQVLM